MGLFTSKPPQEINFKIYTNEYLKLKKPTEEEAEEETVFKFTALGEFAFKNKSNVPYEVLEAGDFSSDSIQATPFTIQIRAIYTPIITSKKDTQEKLAKKVSKTIDILQSYRISNTLLTIIDQYPLFNIYKDLLLTDFQYELVGGMKLVAMLSFQEARISNNNADGLPDDEIEDPEDGASKDGGTVTSKTTTKEVNPT